jgi:hypothetical protein
MTGERDKAPTSRDRDGTVPTRRSAHEKERRARLAKALRKNLRRRKQQERDREINDGSHERR